MNLKQINARKALYNLASMDGRVFGDYLLPLSEKCYEKGGGKSIIFIQGIASSPLRTWAIPQSDQVWPPLLLPDHKVYAIQYETKILDS